MSNTISNFISGFDGGTRLNRFRVASTGQMTVTDFHIVAASIPGSKISPIPISYRGKTIFLPGERSYDPWTITVLDEAGTGANGLHKKFMDWHNKISPLGDGLNVDDFVGSVNNSKWIVEHLDHDVAGTGSGTVANRIKSFALANCWPIEIGPINLDMSANNQLAAFSVTIVYTHISDFVHS